ncbi:MAG TPA: hypothetical protein PKN56_26710 [Leptospiraceae bacterium]|nr:hypothetical protein [Leptospiraceae bacterium]HNI98033.1 hypothetical protein [Leptospiraceae bacterium]HNM06114.1 hypothetical protein [Leptospiraceae bacterium]HNN07173.1 hypothetical protein [Leptospiraceae bacterium]
MKNKFAWSTKLEYRFFRNDTIMMRILLSVILFNSLSCFLEKKEKGKLYFLKVKFEDDNAVTSPFTFALSSEFPERNFRYSSEGLRIIKYPVVPILGTADISYSVRSYDRFQDFSFQLYSGNYYGILMLKKDLYITFGFQSPETYSGNFVPYDQMDCGKAEKSFSSQVENIFFEQIRCPKISITGKNSILLISKKTETANDAMFEIRFQK